jgi:hypothetical protein
MKGRDVVFFLLVTILPTLGFGQSTLNFPKLFSAAELPNAGLAVVNPSSSTATVTFKLYSATGQLIATHDFDYAPGTQLARGSTEVFPTAFGSAGWVQVTSSTTGLQGFWLNYDAALTQYVDGAESATPFAEQVIPLVAGQTELNVANPNSSTVTPAIRVYGEAGTELASTVSPSISPGGVYQNQVATMFSLSASTMASARYVKITAGASTPLLATAVIRDYLTTGTETAVINGASTASTVTEADFPHIINGYAGADYVTEVGVTNLSSSQQNVTITFTPVDVTQACPVSTTSVQRTLAASGALRDTAKNLFSLPDCFVNGWVKVTSPSPIAGFAAYSGGGAVAVVPVQAAPSTNLVFAHIANQQVFWTTGIALLNATSSPANVEIYAMRPDGSLIGGAVDAPDTAKFILGPGLKISRKLGEFIPAADTRPFPEDGGFVFVRTTNNVGLYGIELFYTPGVKILSNVAAGTLAPGITYTPPPPNLPLSLTSVSPAKVAIGGTLTLNGTGFSTTPSDNTVIFTSAAGTTGVAASTATFTSVTVTVPASAISGPVQVRKGGETTNATNTIIDVTASSSTLLQTAVNVGAGQTVSNLDIYVPVTSNGALNATEFGLADVGATFVNFAAASVEISRGATKQLVVVGTGISAASGTTVSFSGTGITVTGPITYSFLGDGTSFLSTTITVAGNAALGARNIIVTNSNLNTSVLTGGLFIR